MEGDRVAFVAQKGLPGGHGFKDAALAFFAEVVVDAAMTGDEAHNAFGQVGVEVVADDAPAHFRRDRAEEAVEEGGEIVLGAAVADRAQDRSGGHIEGGDQGLCAVSPVFEFVSFHLARSHGQVGGHPLKRLDAGHFVNRYRAHRPRIFQRPTVNRADIGAFGLEIRIRFGRQPRGASNGA